MTTSRTIVAGYDGSPAARAAVEHALDRLAPDATLVVVHAYDVPPGFIGASYDKHMLERAASEAAAIMAGLEADCPRLREVDYEPDIIPGAPADAIVRVAKTRGAGEIVMGTRGVGRVRGLLGSVAHDVLHRAPCPVVVIPSHIVEEVAGTAQVATSA